MYTALLWIGYYWIVFTVRKSTSTLITEQFYRASHGHTDVSDCADLAFSDEEKQKCEEALKTKQISKSSSSSQGSPYSFSNQHSSWQCDHHSNDQLIYNVTQGVLLSSSFNGDPTDQEIDCYWAIETYEDMVIELWIDWIYLENGSEVQVCTQYCSSITSTESSPVRRPGSSRIGSHSIGIALFSINQDDQLKIRFRVINNTIDISNNDACTGVAAKLVTLTDSTIKISTPGYASEYDEPLLPHNTFCQWAVESPEDMVIEVTTEYLSLEESGDGDCWYDYLEFRPMSSSFSYMDPFSDSYELLQRQCGEELYSDTTYYSNSSYLLITVRSDAIGQSGGFSANLRAVPRTMIPSCGGNFTGGGNIMSPNYPNAYPTSIECWWELSVEEHLYLQLDIIDFEVEPSSGCLQYDWLLIMVGDEEIARLCGYIPLRSFYSNNNRMTLQFYSDYVAPDRGFHIQYSGTESIATSPTSSSPVQTTAEPDCGGSFQGSGLIASPNYPNHYENYMNCVWELHVNESEVVYVYFHTFNLEQNYDYVRLYNSYPDDVIASLTGSSLQTLVYSSTYNHMTVRFTSDYSVVRQGFQLEFNSVVPSTLPPEPSACGIIEASDGAITSPNYPRNYPNNVDCEWNIIGNSSSVIRLFVEYFITESCCDWLSISDDITDETLAYMRGSGFTGSTYISTSNYVTITFHTDSSVTRQGFNISFDSVNLLEEACDNTNDITLTSGYLTLPEEFTPECDEYTWSVATDELTIMSLMPYHHVLDCSYATLVITVNNIAHEICGGDFSSTTLLGFSNQALVRLSVHTTETVTLNGIQLKFTEFDSAAFGDIICESQNGTISLTASALSFNLDLIFSQSRDTSCQLLLIPENDNEFVDLTVLGISANGATYLGESRLSVADGDTSDALAFPHVTLPIHDSQQRTMRSTTSEGLLITIDPTSNLLVSLRYVTSPVPGRHPNLYPLCENNTTLSVGDTLSSSSSDYCESWTIVEGVLFLDEFHLRTNSRYCLDLFELYDVNEDGSRIYRESYCESLGNFKIAGQTNQMLLYYRASDYSASLTGTVHEMDTEVHDCGPLQTFTAPDQFTLQVNPSTGHYYPNTICSYLITADSGMLISLNFTEVDVEQEASCIYDAIVVYDGATSEAPSRYLCGQHMTLTRYSSGNSILIHFTSDGVIEATGFTVRFEQIDPDSVPWLQCGRPQVQPRIVGGDDAIPHSIPWQVALRRSSSSSPFCGGTIISPRRIMTAAHCVDAEIPSGFIVSVGLHDYTEDDTTQTMTIEEIIMHPQYTYYAEGLDVAVLILAEAIEMNERAAPACLPTRLPRVGDKCIASGWGRLSYGGSQPDILQVLEMDYVTNDECEQRWGTVLIDDTMICMFHNNLKGPCNGDSGGPMSCVDEDTGSWVVYGAASFGSYCDGTKPLVFGNIYHLLEENWLQQYLEF